MIQLTKRIAAALCAGLLLTTFTGMTSHAEEEETVAITLPSGLNIQQLQQELRDASRQMDFASAAVAVFQGDEVLYTEYFGETDIDNHIPADENSVYEWGSISKTLIWVSAMQLYEQGKLDLEKDVREYLPDGFFQHLSYDEPITMLNLMNHNAGWQETLRPIETTMESEVLPLEQALQAIEPAQVHPPGEVTAYSNYGAAVAGYVIECVSGQDYCDYVHAHIFEPLGMAHTALNPTHSDNTWVQEQRKKMKSYRFSLGNRIDLGYRLNYIAAYPAGAATGTLTDLMTYAQALSDETAPLFQNPATQELLYTGTDFYGASDIPMCAHGFWCEEYAVRTYGHSGATHAGQSNMLFDLDSGTGLVIMVNEPEGNSLLADAPALVFGELSPEKYASGIPENAAFSGYYLPARDTYRGMMKLSPYLSAISSGVLKDVQDIGNGVYQLAYEESAFLLGAKTYPDGSTALQQESMDLLHDSFYLVKLCLLTAYILLAIVSVFMLLIQRKLKKYGKWEHFSGEGFLTAGRTAQLVSVLLLPVLMIVWQQNGGGLPYTAGAVIGILQMICMAVCGAAGIAALVLLFRKELSAYRCILHTFGNVLTLTAVIYFELFRFWGC